LIEGPPRLLQIWGVVALAVVAIIAFLLAYRWYRARPTRPHLHLDVAAISSLALLTGGFFWRPLTESGIYMPAGGGDLASFYFPTYSYVASQVKSGTMPLWNPHLFAGMPLAADVQTALFYPLNWILFLFVDVDYGGLEWLLIVHYWLASVFTYLFLRDLKLSRLASIAGGTAFAFCGFMVAHFGHLPMVPVATWIPLVLLALRRALITPSLMGWVWAILAGLFLTMSLLAGHVQIFAYGLMAAGLLWLYLFFTEGPWSPADRPPTADDNSKLVNWVLKGALVLAIALAIGAVQLLPSLELSTQSVRASVSYEEASEFPAQPVSLLNLILPTIYGSNPTTYSFGIWQTTENWGYCGVVTLALAAAGLVLRRARMIGFFALLVVLALIIMAGDLTIVGGWIYKFVPGFNKLRDSGRALVLLGFGLAGLAAYGIDALVDALSLRVPSESRRTVFWWLVGLTGLLALAAFGIMPALYKDILTDPNGPYGKLATAINDLGMLLLWLGLLAGVCWAAYKGRIDHRLAGAAMLLLLVLDLFSPNSRFNPTTTNVLAGYQNFDAIGLVDKVTRDRATGIPLRVDSDTNVQDVWQPSTVTLPGVSLYDTGGAWNPLKLDRYDYLWGVAKLNPDSPLYDLTGASVQVAAPTITHENQSKWSLIERDPGFNVYQNKNALPRLFLVHESRIETDKAKLLDVIRRFDVDPRHTILLSSGTAIQSSQPGTAEPVLGLRPIQASGQSPAEAVRATRYTPNAVDITVKATSPGWVVLTDAWYPGWQATLDNKPVPIEPAYYAYRAVKVDTGDHMISLQFQPTTWVWGRVISLVAIVAAPAGLVALIILMRRRSRPTNTAN
jgi:hypothetical protein